MSNFYARACKNGHLDITYRRAGKGELCKECGEPIMDSCPVCGELIKQWHYYGMVYLTPKNLKFQLPDNCPHCGAGLPWSKNDKSAVGEITTILWDVDGTLLDFSASEEACIRRCFDKYGVPINRHELEWYSECNHSYWKRLERGEITRSQVYLGRFEDFFEYLGVSNIPAEQFNDEYQEALGLSVVMQDGAMEICRYLKDKGGYRQYVVTNGSAVAQKGKLKSSGLGALMDGVFISEEIGAEKPSKEFFDVCGAHIPDYEPSKTMIIGDSLSSDMAGGNNAGITCCWFNPGGAQRPDGVRIDYEIKTLKALEQIL